tara:strand:- start:955 stop:1215 length:261 start_codon:yes stop_codon:yes gene_type:complete
MKTSIKILLLKSITFIVGFAAMIFGVGSGIVIFTRSSEIILHMPYTKAEASAIMVGIGIALIWLIGLLTESVEWIIREGFKKAENI